MVDTPLYVTLDSIQQESVAANDPDAGKILINKTNTVGMGQTFLCRQAGTWNENKEMARRSLDNGVERQETQSSRGDHHIQAVEKIKAH